MITGIVILSIYIAFVFCAISLMRRIEKRHFDNSKSIDRIRSLLPAPAPKLEMTQKEFNEMTDKFKGLNDE